MRPCVPRLRTASSRAAEVVCVLFGLLSLAFLLVIFVCAFGRAR